MRYWLTIIFSSLLASIAFASTTIYETKDKEGHKVFSDQTPRQGKVIKKIEIETDASDYKKHLQKIDEENEALNQSLSKISQDRAVLSENIKQAYRHLNVADERLKLIEQSIAELKKQAPPAYYNDKEGKPVYNPEKAVYDEKLKHFEMQLIDAKADLAKAQADLVAAKTALRKYRPDDAQGGD